MDHVAAYDALVRLLDVDSVETRVGAFRALRVRNPLDPMVRGARLGDEFGFHVVASEGAPFVHFAASRRPEIILFGRDQRLASSGFLFAGKGIMINGCGGDRLKLSRFEPGEEDRHEMSSTRLDEVIRKVAELGGGYADVKQAVDEAKSREYLASRVVVDALPRPGRRYYRELDDEDGSGAASPADVASPFPDLFSNRLAARSRASEPSSGEAVVGQSSGNDGEQRRSSAGFFDRMGKWFSD
jgi:hypothetical protein